MSSGRQAVVNVILGLPFLNLTKNFLTVSFSLRTLVIGLLFPKLAVFQKVVFKSVQAGADLYDYAHELRLIVRQLKIDLMLLLFEKD